MKLSQIYTQAVAKRLAFSALKKNEQAWQKLYDELQETMTRAWDENMRNAIASALNNLLALDKGKFTQADIDLISRTLENHVGVQAMTAALHGPMLNISEVLYKLGFTQTAKENKLVQEGGSFQTT